MMQLPPSDEIVMMSGLQPIRAKKARYYEDPRFRERILPPPASLAAAEVCPDDWTGRPLPAQPDLPDLEEGESEDDDPKATACRRQPELDPAEPVEQRTATESDLSLDIATELEEQVPRAGRMRELTQGIARQASLDPGDDLGL